MPILESDMQANNSSSDVVNHDAGQYDESLAGKLSREVGLLAQMPGAALQAAVETLQDPGDLALKLGAAFGTGIGIAAIRNNPNAFGAIFSPIFKVGVGIVEKAGLGVMAMDWGGRIGSPMAATWESGANDAEARKAIGQNVGEGLVYYSVGMAGFASGRSVWSDAFPKSTATISQRFFSSELAGNTGKINGSAFERALAPKNPFESVLPTPKVSLTSSIRSSINSSPLKPFFEFPATLSRDDSFLGLVASSGYVMPRVLTTGDRRNFYDRYKI
ncbi:MAG: hypothetical protein WCT03_25965, partial [Candidatus Obscuribacterales bacterium]|jgi:hypothetical protein